MFNRREWWKKYYEKNCKRIDEKHKQWRINNIKKIKEYQKKYQKKNRNKLNKQSKVWRINNPEKTKNIQRKYYQNNSNERKKATKQWRKDNPEKEKERMEQWYKDNPQYNREWRKNNIGRINEYYRNKRKTDLKFNLNQKISRGMKRTLKNGKNGKHWEDLVGYTMNDLIKRLKKTVPGGYNWDDFLQGKLHIDHKIPVIAFNFIKSEHPDFKRCWALSNLQLLSAKENRVKHDKLLKPFQPTLKISIKKGR